MKKLSLNYFNLNRAQKCCVRLNVCSCFIYRYVCSSLFALDKEGTFTFESLLFKFVLLHSFGVPPHYKGVSRCWGMGGVGLHSMREGVKNL